MRKKHRIPTIELPEQKNVLALRKHYLKFLEEKELKEDPEIEAKAQKEFDETYAKLLEIAEKGDRVLYVILPDKLLKRTQRKLDAAGFTVYDAYNQLTIRW
jgi:hypothetical protein